MDWHRGIRAAYPNALLTISGDTLEDLVVINQKTGEPFVFDQAQVESSYQTVASEEALTKLRSKRNRLLAETDWWVFPDSPEATAEQLAYRQALRDLPANTTDPANPVWPTKP